MIKKGLYKVIDEDNQEALMKVIENEKSLVFELVGEKPRFTYGDIDEFIYNQPNKKRTLQKIIVDHDKFEFKLHSFRIINDDKFVLYPYRSGNPYLFVFVKDN